MSALTRQGQRVLAQFAGSGASRGSGPWAPAGLWQASSLTSRSSGSGHCSTSHHSNATGGHQAVTHATTILCLRKGADVVIIGDGQATQGDFIVKPNVTKVRRIGDKVIGGFAGRAADGLALLERLETKLEEHPGQLKRAAVELAKLWRQDKMLRNLDASLLVADDQSTLWLMGNGDVVESADGIMGIGSGSDFAEAAARALMDLPQSNNMDIMAIAKKAMHIAADCCVYTNHNFMWHMLRNGSIQSGSSNSSSKQGQPDASTAV